MGKIGGKGMAIMVAVILLAGIGSLAYSGVFGDLFRKSPAESAKAAGVVETADAVKILDLFSEWHARGKTVLMVTHNPANLARATRSLRLRDGRVEEDRTLRPLTAEPVAV